MISMRVSVCVQALDCGIHFHIYSACLLVSHSAILVPHSEIKCCLAKCQASTSHCQVSLLPRPCHLQPHSGWVKHCSYHDRFSQSSSLMSTFTLTCAASTPIACRASAASTPIACRASAASTPISCRATSASTHISCRATSASRLPRQRRSPGRTKL
ncbi:hypothetical protein DEU56DRAFT_130280 [Suillus clintonianus]|uniref:uncharacterized protein n=1 Tax=Suillus clintonianus TaxID=1904413 RepID=UPI001B8822D1|nr:uncharacterized protein DEU56DRAFT_130280 [Suillus clintonianus]KAG2147607.1 hypothetical protein DEU56DRAFT_130280 [Suillus clintonianus]